MISAALATAPSASRIVWRPTLAVGLAVLCSIVMSCGGDTRPETFGAVYRFVEFPAQEVFDVRDIAAESTVLDLSPDPALENGGWELGGLAEGAGWKDGRLRVRMKGKGEAVLTRAVVQPVAEVDVVELEIGGLQPWNSVVLMWADEGQSFNNRQSIRLGARQGEGTGTTTFWLHVGRQSSWSDAVRRIRILVTGEKQNVFIGRVVGINFVLEEDRLAAACAGSWLAELNGNFRGVVFGLPGTSIQGIVELPPGAELRFGTGLGPTQPVPVRFRLSVAGEGGDPSSSVVFDETLAGSPDAGWTDHAVDLSAYAGRRVRLSLEVEAEAEFDPLLGLPMWANPVVWASSTDDRPPNVVLISVDTLRADRMSLYGYERSTTPLIARWARGRAVVFESVVAPSPWTLPSHVSIMTGLDAIGHGVNHPAPAPATLLTLAEMLHLQGYTTVAVTGGSYLHPRFGLAQGFDDYRPFKGDLAVELETQIGEALSWLDENAARTPFFLFFHTYEVHDPYDPREPYFSEFTGGPFDPQYRDAVTRNVDDLRPDRLRGTNQFVLRGVEDDAETLVAWEDVGVVSDLYDSGIAYADELLGRLLERASRADLRDTTMVILTSDHGEALGEHQLAGHSSLYDHDLLVPLVIAPPGGSGRRSRVATQVRSVDIPATVLDIAGLPAPPGIDGKTLVPLMAGEERDPRPASSYAALSNHGLGLRTGDDSMYIFRNIPWIIPAGWEEYYDLELDPGEQHNLGPGGGQIEALRSLARETLIGRQSGLRLTLTNHGDLPCRIEFIGTGISIGASTVKAIAPGGGCSIVRRGKVGCDLAPETAITLICERVHDPRVEFDGTIAAEGRSGSVPFQLGFEVGIDHEPRTVVFDSSRGSLTNGPAGKGAISISVDWVGNPGILGLDPADSDMELRRQLEALGYIQSQDPAKTE